MEDLPYIVGKNNLLLKAINDAIKISLYKSNVIIYGESGTGKELIAKLIYEYNIKESKPFIKVNCSSLNENLIESELYGHAKGSYTGACKNRIGKFEAANGGTIFLDEIGDIPLNIQTKLLRTLEEREIEKIGSNKVVKINVRVLSATNKNLEKEVAEGHFREDLYYRLNVVQINLPPLRERMEDIPVLAEHFLNMFREETGISHLTISKQAMEKMVEYDWPGNIRELRNAIERAVVMGNGQTILPEDLPIKSSKPNFPGLQVGLTLEDALNQFKKEFIILTLKFTGGNRSKAAKVMDIQRTYLSRLISKYGLRSL